jgi:hypothetical protein
MALHQRKVLGVISLRNHSLTVEGCKLGNFKKINNVEEKRIRSDDIINSYPFRNTSVT